MIKVALAGNPNCGKTTLFNSLTGSTAYVGNWPGVTVEKREGTYLRKGEKDKSKGIDIVDLPGIYSLSPYTPEEVISRDYILEEKPDVVINVVDATNLERNLYLTTQILEMDVPVVVALNMIDAIAENGIEIDVPALQKKLGVPVVAISALRERGLGELMKEVEKAAKPSRKGASCLPYASLKEASALYLEAGVASPLFHAIKALEKDEEEEKKSPEVYAKVQALVAQDGIDYEAGVADMRYQYLTPICEALVKGRVKQESQKLSKSDKIDKVLTNRWLGLLIAAVVLFLIFHFTFSGDLLYLHAFGVDFGDGYEGAITITLMGEEEAYHPFAGLFYTDGGINSIGEFFHVLVGDAETGVLGCICLGIKQLLLMWNSPEWVIGFFYDGVLNGIAAVLGFVPQIMILFAFFAILEDSGYMARIAFILDRIFRRFGVSGRAFIPMIMGFGCGIPAMINTRTLASDKERTKTIRAIPMFACGAKAEFIAIIAAFIGSATPLDSGLFTFLLYLFSIIVGMFAVILMNKTTQREKTPPFIMELPAYHRPQIKAMALHVWDKGKHFIKKAFTLIFVSTIIVWFLSNFTVDWTFIPTAAEELALTSKDSILADIGNLILPLFTPMGFGYNTAALRENGWILSVASIQGIVAKENVTATVESLVAGLGLSSFEEFAAFINLTPAAAAAFATFNLMTIPCFASVATAKAELSSRKAYLGTLGWWLAISYVSGVVVYWTFTAPWTLAITLGVLALGCVGVFFYDRHMKKKEAAEEAAEAAK